VEQEEQVNTDINDSDRLVKGGLKGSGAGKHGERGEALLEMMFTAKRKELDTRGWKEENRGYEHD
jgi:hypothetical protein